MSCHPKAREQTFTRPVTTKITFLHACFRFRRSDCEVKGLRQSHERSADSDATKNSLGQRRRGKNEMRSSHLPSTCPDDRTVGADRTAQNLRVASENSRSRIREANERVVTESSGKSRSELGSKIIMNPSQRWIHAPLSNKPVYTTMGIEIEPTKRIASARARLKDENNGMPVRNERLSDWLLPSRSDSTRL